MTDTENRREEDNKVADFFPYMNILQTAFVLSKNREGKKSWAVDAPSAPSLPLGLPVYKQPGGQTLS